MDTTLNNVIFKELESCTLCAWECGVDRLAGEKGVCLMGIPEVASCQLHPAPPQGKILYCALFEVQNIKISSFLRSLPPLTGVNIPIEAYFKNSKIDIKL